MSKSIAKKIFDGSMNVFKYGRLHQFEHYPKSKNSSLNGVTERIREIRTKDVTELRALLQEYECQYIDEGHHKFLCFNYYHSGDLEKAAQFADKVSSKVTFRTDKIMLENIKFEWRALNLLRDGQPPVELDFRVKLEKRDPKNLRSLYIAASCLPFVLSGYTVRTNAIIQSIADGCLSAVVPLTRPGFPFDRPDLKDLGFDGDNSAHFNHIDCKQSYRGDMNVYLQSILPDLEDFVKCQEIDIIHGVSNYRNGVIGLALARRLRLPFVYEIRGLWEETTAAKRSGWRDTMRYEYERRFEKFLYSEADGVLTINRQVRRLLEVSVRNNSELLPNCVPHKTIKSARVTKAKTRAVRLGYIGSILEYEGLDDLLTAVAKLKKMRYRMTLDIYGSGEFLAKLLCMAKQLNLKSIVKFHGQVAPERVADLYDGFDLCVFARKPYDVCKLVTPLKPIEAMANGVNCLVSDVPPMFDIAKFGGALTFEAGNVESLVNSLRRFCEMSHDERQFYVDEARNMIADNYTWERQALTISEVYKNSFGD